ncbi:MarR family winged helix-turn-helix transcriptional regulator [Paenibacillus sp. GCM10012306]|uniref:MarR family winged helix-turn-helix transcriptional regulator n=1 Tax=Paenibacillus sp. GCM10012306 TaxID=3317342 RepID=UPI00360D39B9
MLHKVQWQHTVEGNKPSEMTLMICIRKHRHSNEQGLKVSEIGRILGWAAPTVTQLVNSLEARGMVERQADSEDRRAVRIQLTEQGKKVTRRVHAYMNEELVKLVEYLGEDESNQLCDLLLKVHAYALSSPRPDFDRLPMNGDENLD